MIWCRIDNRLVHGQVVEAWLPYTGASFLAVVNNVLSEDEIQQQIMLLAIPNRIRTVFITVEEAPALAARQLAKKEKTLMLFANCLDAKNAVEAGLKIDNFNIGNLHYSSGKKQICDHVAVSQEDCSCLEYFRRHGINLDFRCVPNDLPQVKPWG